MLPAEMIARDDVALPTWARMRESDLDRALVQSTIAAAKVSPRLRAHAALPTTDDGWPCTLIAMTLDSYVRPHFHPISVDPNHNCERLLSLRGRCAALLFDARGQFEVVYLDPEQSEIAVIREARTSDVTQTTGSRSIVKGIEIGAGIAHSLIAIDEVAVVSEYKSGEAGATHHKVFVETFPPEGDNAVPATMRAWRQAVDSRVLK